MRYFPSPKRAQAWARKMCRWLKTKPRGIYRVLHSAAAIRRKRIVVGAKRKQYRDAYNYLRKRIRFLDYCQYRRNHLPIGSGVTEAACKTVFTQRLKQSGMTWKLEGGQWIVDLRVIHLSGIWSQVYQAYLQVARRDDSLQSQLDRDLADLKLLEIARSYREVLDEAARKGSSMLEVLATLIGMEQTVRQQRALERRLRQARLPKQKTLADYDFNFPKRDSQGGHRPPVRLRLHPAAWLRRSDRADRNGKDASSHGLGLHRCERGYSVRYTRRGGHAQSLTTAQINGLLGKALKTYVRPTLLLLDELGYLPIDKRGADLLFQVVAARYESGSIVLTTNRPFREWGALFDVDNTLATALIDRLMHHGEAIVIQGDSYRMRDKDSDVPIRPARDQTRRVNVRSGLFDAK